MRINLDCPFKDKDEAKQLGAKWDPARRVWYIVDMEDLTPFMRWIPRSAADVRNDASRREVTLATYLGKTYGGKCVSLTHAAARAFGIPWPLESGWAKTYAWRSISVDKMNQLGRSKKSKVKSNGSKKGKAQHSSSPPTTGGEYRPLCSCKVLPWEDCEHTEREIQSAMAQILDLNVNQYGVQYSNEQTSRY